MSEPRVVHVQFEDNGDIQIHWTRPSDHSEFAATYHTTLISREGLESDEDLTYYASEVRDDVYEMLMAWLKLSNRADKV